MRLFVRNLAVAGAVALLCGAAAFAGGNTLAVNSPGLDGNFKMEIVLDGVSNNQVWVQDNTPVCESTYNVEWKFATPNLAAGELDLDDAVTAFLGRQETPAGNVVRCLLQSQPGGAFNPQVRCSVRWDDNKIRFIGQSAYNPNFAHTFRFEMVKASGPASGDGVARFYRNGNLLFQRSDIQNFNHCYDRQRLGVGQPVPANTIGVATEIQYDSFVSTR